MIKQNIRKILPKNVIYLYRFLATKDKSGRSVPERSIVLRFLFNGHSGMTFFQRLRLIQSMYAISEEVSCPHLQSEVLAFMEAILAIPQSVSGCVVEAGCYKGGSTSKFSLAAKAAGRRLVVFDSFAGIPPNDEKTSGGKYIHDPGKWCGTMDEVKSNITTHGDISVVEFVPGLFDDTMPEFSKPVAAAYVDVDLASSTKTCLKYLYPLLIPGGVLYSQDGHLANVVQVYDDDDFWKNEVGFPKPYIEGLRKQKLIKIVKPPQS
jgi:O-methyltransferase